MSYTVADGDKVIPRGAFARNYDISEIDLPDSVEIIGDQAFWASSVKRISLPANLREIGDSAFRGSDLEEIDLPPDVKVIRRGAFMECTSLKRAFLPEGLEEIGHNAFQYSYELQEVNIPSTVKVFGKMIFDECKALKKLTCSDNFVIGTDTFGKEFPNGLIRDIEALEKNMTATAYQQYVLNERVWSKLSSETQVSFFIRRNTKGCLYGYSRCIKAEDAERFGESLLKAVTGKDSTKDHDRALFNFISLFYDLADKDTIKRMIAFLKSRESAVKLVAELEQSERIMNAVNGDSLNGDVEECPSDTHETFCYEDADLLNDSFYESFDDPDVSEPVKTGLKKTIVTCGKQKFTVKFQSDKAQNEQLNAFLSSQRYDPCLILKNSLYDELSETVQYYNLEQPQERLFIRVKDGTDPVTADVLKKRLKLYAGTVSRLKDDDVLGKIIAEMPRKKNGALFLKRTVALVPVMIVDEELGSWVLCAKAVKDYEAEISLKYYSFGRIEDYREFLKTEDRIYCSVFS